MLKPLPIGTSDFRKLREAGLEYIDKSQLLQGLLEDQGGEVFLFPRPRRFGKTLNLSMMRHYLEKRTEDLSHLFEGLQIWDESADHRAHFQRYPVIFLTFKDLKPSSLEGWHAGIRRLIRQLFFAHRTLLEAQLLEGIEARDLEAILEERADPATLLDALKSLTEWLYRRDGERVVVLIDEYDTPIHAAFLGGFGETVLSFFRGFLGAGLKDNPCLFKGVITGILRVAKENIFSGLNNLQVFGLLRQEYADCFGFTEAEVQALLVRAEQTECLERVRSWYNGYVFGGRVVYNPWSVLNFIKNPDKTPQAYWVNTSSNDLVREHLVRHALSVEADVRTLLEGGEIEKRVDENVVLSQVVEDPGALWSLLLFSGYLKARVLPGDPDQEARYGLSVPNLEVRTVYLRTFQRWMERQVPGHSAGVDALLRAMFSGDVERFEVLLEGFAQSIFSFHDQPSWDLEAVPHGFLLGLCAVLEGSHRVLSNRESGAGRPDVLVVPRVAGQPGVVLEIKVGRPGRKTLEQALAEGLNQLQNKDYGAELRAAGAEPIQAYAVAFLGKEVRVACAGSDSEPMQH